MTDTFNVYCDESCHLENDHQKAMVATIAQAQFDNQTELGALLPVILDRDFKGKL